MGCCFYYYYVFTYYRWGEEEEENRMKMEWMKEGGNECKMDNWNDGWGGRKKSFSGHVESVEFGSDGNTLLVARVPNVCTVVRKWKRLKL